MKGNGKNIDITKKYLSKYLTYVILYYYLCVSKS